VALGDHEPTSQAIGPARHNPEREAGEKPTLKKACVHQWGWTFVLNADGTTTAASPDGSRILRSHSPPTSAG